MIFFSLIGLFIGCLFAGFSQRLSIICIFHSFIMKYVYTWKSHATLTLLAKQDLPTFGYNMADPLKSWCWGQFYFTLLKFPVFLRP